ncbi:MAG: Cof-type HAD-IIB family hydrolase [Erysipelotrichaceae bacterium]|nr:Cof-type HAD-IIB family hydrolase [Erysipelotrichaceae bacterium]
MSKIIFLDIDGTLTMPDIGVTDKVKYAIKKARENGNYVFICSGRNKAGVRSLEYIGFDGLICCAGGYIEVNGQKIYESALSDDKLKLARDVFDRNHVLYNMEATHLTFQSKAMSEMFVSQRLDGNMNSELQRMINEEKDMFNIHSFEDFEANPMPIQKMSFICQDISQLDEPKEVLSKDFNFVVHDVFSRNTINGEIIVKGTDKGKAIHKVVDYLGLSIEDTIGFGDSMNDLQMIQTCHRGVVMGNGSDELKQYATTICESVRDDGIYHELDRLGLIG